MEVWKMSNFSRPGCIRLSVIRIVLYIILTLLTSFISSTQYMLTSIELQYCARIVMQTYTASRLPSSPLVSWPSVFTCCFCWLIWFCRVATISGITASMSDKDSTILCSVPSSPIIISASVYCNPFWIIDNSAAGGTRAPLMLLCDMWDSIPNVYAECWKPARNKDSLTAKSFWNRASCYAWAALNSGNLNPL